MIVSPCNAPPTVSFPREFSSSCCPRSRFLLNNNRRTYEQQPYLPPPPLCQKITRSDGEKTQTQWPLILFRHLNLILPECIIRYHFPVLTHRCQLSCMSLLVFLMCLALWKTSPSFQSSSPGKMEAYAMISRVSPFFFLLFVFFFLAHTERGNDFFVPNLFLKCQISSVSTCLFFFHPWYRRPWPSPSCYFLFFLNRTVMLISSKPHANTDL